MIVSEEVQLQIKYLCSKFQKVEWSGILFYKKVSGDLDDVENLVFETVYIHLMDIGTAGYTEFNSDPSFMALLDEREDLETCMQGLVHSHNNMGVFFSGTDIDELIESTTFFNVYLSLIVNNRYDLTAKLAYKREVETTITTDYSLEKLDYSTVPFSLEEVKKETVVVLIDGKVKSTKIKYGVSDSFKDRTKVLKEKIKASAKHKVVVPYTNAGYNPTPLYNENIEVEELSDFKASVEQLNTFTKYMIVKYLDYPLFKDEDKFNKVMKSRLLHQLIVSITSKNKINVSKYTLFIDFQEKFDKSAKEAFDIDSPEDLYELASLLYAHLNSIKKIFNNKNKTFITKLMSELQKCVKNYYTSCKEMSDEYDLSNTNFIL